MPSTFHRPVRGRRSNGRDVEPSAPERAAVAAELGQRHPLVGLLVAKHATEPQMLAVAPLVAGALLGRWPALLVAATVVEAALALRWLCLRVAIFDVCCDVLIDAHESLPSRAVQTVRRRLARPEEHAILAASLESMVASSHQPASPLRAFRPPFASSTVRAVEPEMRQVAQQLRSGPCGLRGVALVHRLLTSGQSPLYGSDVEQLRQELGRVRYLLRSR